MCAVVPVIMALSIASEVAKGYAQTQQAAATQKALGQQRAAQQQEINAQATIRAGQQVKQSRAERAKLITAAGEAGVGGVSLGDILATNSQNEGENLALIQKNAYYQDRASAADYAAGMSKAQGPSALELGLGIGGAALSGYSSGVAFEDQLKAHK